MGKVIKHEDMTVALAEALIGSTLKSVVKNGVFYELTFIKEGRVFMLPIPNSVGFEFYELESTGDGR